MKVIRPLDSLALRATLHCLAGCMIGEVLGMLLGNLLGWPNPVTVVVSIVLAFASGFGLTLWPMLAAGLPLRRAIGITIAADAASITVMEIVDNAVMLAIPGAMDAHAASAHFWLAMLVSLVASGLAAFPLNRWLIARGRGHAVVHAHHAHGGDERDAHHAHGRHAGH